MSAVAAANNGARPVFADTIYALSSGRPPAAIAVIRLSGPDAGRVLSALAGSLPPPRHASLRALRDARGDLLDRALILWFPGPGTATGDDLAELHLHGGNAVVAAVFAALDEAGLRLAEAGEFTRRALLNGRLDLPAVEGLADLLAAETEYQRREALRRASGFLGRQLASWSTDLVAISARIEAEIDYDGEIANDLSVSDDIRALLQTIRSSLNRISAERIRDGLRIAIAGPPNAGKSSLFNALLGRDAAIVSPVAGTTRDTIERPISLGGIPFILVDTAGLREGAEEIERLGIERARAEHGTADILIDLTGEQAGSHVIPVAAKADIAVPRTGAIATSAITGEGIGDLIEAVVVLARSMVPPENEVALDRRYRNGLEKIEAELMSALVTEEPVLAAEHIRQARCAMDVITGTAGFEDMLDALFSRFCLGK